MTIKYVAFIECDRCGETMPQSAVSPVAAGLPGKVLPKAKAAGWSRAARSIYLDLCPVCVANSRKDPK